MQNTTGNNESNHAGPIKPQTPTMLWYHKRRIVLPLLALLYPLGLWLLITSPRPGWIRKLLLAVVFLPFFVIVALLPLKPYWQFTGRMRGLEDFSIDMDRLLRRPEARLEAHRTEQESTADEVPPPTHDLDDRDAMPNWTDFRGPERDGIVRGETISLDWNNDPPRELWRQPIGGGHASFVVAGGRAYTIEQRRKQEAVTCYDIINGRELWAYTYDASFEEVLGGNGPRATPTFHEGRLFALGAQGHLHCLDASDGQPIWDVNILIEPARSAGEEQNGKSVANLEWGLSGSPLIVDDIVIVTNSGKSGPSVFGYRIDNGQLVWQADAGSQAYSSLVLTKLDGVRQVLNLGGTELRGIDPATGEILWRHPWHTYMWINVSQPLTIGDDRVFVSAAYDHGCALIEVRTDNGAWKTTEIWKTKRLRNKFSSSVLFEGHLYGLDEAILTCVSLETGARRWKAGRYNYGSLLLVNDHLLVMSEQPADLILIKADPTELKELGRVRVFGERTWNNFVLVAGRVLARNDRWMACYDLRPTAAAARTAEETDDREDTAE